MRLFLKMQDERVRTLSFTGADKYAPIIFDYFDPLPMYSLPPGRTSTPAGQL